MAINYRDYGAFEESTAPQVAINTIRHSDVYLATHDGEGNRLSYCERSFISFTYGGRHIEDFGAIAVTEGDRWSHPMYAEFSDITNNPEVYDGQLYWDTHHGANTWELQLSTDCMTEKNLNDFKNWFKPGVIRELILAEHPNRAIMARVSAVPAMSVLPFEEDSEVTLGSTSHKVRSTVYKGEISLSFVMDYPFWYAKNNILFLPNPDITYTDGANYTGNFSVEDSVKIIVEDNLVADDYISIQAEGAIAAFESPIETNLTSVEVTIDPVQDLHGYDAPWPAGGGKNKYSGPADVVVDNQLFVDIQVDPIPTGTYTLSATLVTAPAGYTTCRVAFRKADGSAIEAVSLPYVANTRTSVSFTLSDTCERIYFYYSATTTGTGSQTYQKVQIELGSTATSYAPYSNVCPISGWTGANVIRTGKNLLDTSNATHSNYNFGNIPNTLKEGATYTFRINGTTSYSYRLYLSNSSNPLSGLIALTPVYAATGVSKTFIAPDMQGYDTLCLAGNMSGAGNDPLDDILPQLEKGSTATAYEPYTGTTYPISWQTVAGTVYGGTLDVTTGVLTVTHKGVDLGTIQFYGTDVSGEFSATKPTDCVSGVSNVVSGIICSIYKTSARTGQTDKTIALSPSYLFIRDSDYSDAATLNVALSGVQLVYELITPVTYQLTPQQITALKGANNVWCDTGDIAIDFTPGMVSPGYFIGDIETGVIILRNEAGSNPLYGYMYYAGTAPCRPIIEFDLTPEVNTAGYIEIPRNSIGTVSEQTNPYNYIRFESENKYDLNITTPGIYSTYNYARQILDEYATGVSWEELRVAFRDYLKHYDVRAFMMRLIDKYQSSSQTVVASSADITNIKNDMIFYLQDSEAEVEQEEDVPLASVHYYINCETGRAKIRVNHCTLVYDELQDSWAPTYEIVEEDAGDMLKSKYLKLEDRNYLLDNHTCGTWDDTHKQYAYRISTNFPQLNNFKVSYKNMYY